MAHVPTQDPFIESLHSVVVEEIKKYGEDRAKKLLEELTEDFNKQAARIIAAATLETFRLMRTYTKEDELVITVKLPERTEPKEK